MFCPNCGRQAEGVEKFCTQCGAPLEVTATVKTSDSSRWPKIVGIVGALVVVVVIVALLLGGKTPQSSPEAVVGSFLGAWAQGDVQQMLDLWDPEELAQLMRDEELSLQEVREALEQEMEMTGGDLSYSFEIGETTRSNSEALVKVTVEANYPGSGLSEYTTFISTVERGGRWYVKAGQLFGWR